MVDICQCIAFSYIAPISIIGRTARFRTPFLAYVALIKLGKNFNRYRVCINSCGSNGKSSSSVSSKERRMGRVWTPTGYLDTFRQLFFVKITHTNACEMQFQYHMSALRIIFIVILWLWSRSNLLLALLSFAVRAFYAIAGWMHFCTATPLLSLLPVPYLSNGRYVHSIPWGSRLGWKRVFRYLSLFRCGQGHEPCLSPAPFWHYCSREFLNSVQWSGAPFESWISFLNQAFRFSFAIREPLLFVHRQTLHERSRILGRVFLEVKLWHCRLERQFLSSCFFCALARISLSRLVLAVRNSWLRRANFPWGTRYWGTVATNGRAWDWTKPTETMMETTTVEDDCEAVRLAILV